MASSSTTLALVSSSMLLLLLLLCFSSAAHARAATHDALNVDPGGDAGNHDSIDATATAEEATAAGLSVLYRAYQSCQEQKDVVSCLKVRALRALERASRADSLTILDGVSLVRASRSEDTSSQQVLDEAQVPQDPDKLDALILDRAARFLHSHSLQLDVPKLFAESEVDAHENDVEEGRRRRGGMKRYGMLMMMAMMMKSGLMAMAFKGIALLAGKALIVGKIALVLAAVVGLSKLLGGGGGKTTYEIVKHPQISHAYSHSSSHDFGGHGGGGGGGGHYEVSGGGGGGGHGGGWGRSLGEGDAHTIAYVAHAPRPVTTHH